jgi:hypothetical protein
VSEKYNNPHDETYVYMSTSGELFVTNDYELNLKLKYKRRPGHVRIDNEVVELMQTKVALAKLGFECLGYL